MKRLKLWAAGLLTGAGLIVAGAYSTISAQPKSNTSNTDTSKPLAVIPAPNKPNLPIEKVVLFSSGMGYFERGGTVEGSTRLDLSFQANDINDLIKSMVVRDLDGGKITTVSYDSNDPVERTLRSFAINLTGDPTLANILKQARGERVEVQLVPTVTTQPATLVGTLIGVEKQKVPGSAPNQPALEVDVVNLWCADGMRSVKTNEVQRLRFLNANIESEFKRALEVLALSHDSQKKAVSLSFTGEGKRRVQVGYVVESPVWKTSYRLVISEKGEPFLQGWAVVENPSDEDWNGVGMALISGRPISFKMDLYQPLYVPRPTVELELFASLRPPTFSGAMDKQAKAEQATGLPKPGTAANLRGRSSPTAAKDANRAALQDRAEAQLESAERMDLSQGIQSAASGGQLGDFFRYLIEHPVHLARQKSALLPIVNREIKADRISIYNPSVQPKHPLLGLHLKNTTGLHLMQGPITVFEGATYAGDAKAPDIQPGENRLLAYAIDLGTEVEILNPRQQDRLTKVRIERGIVWTTTQIRQERTYRAVNRSGTDRTLWVEHPFRPEFTLIDTPKPVERSRDMYRFEVKLPAGKDGSVQVIEQQDVVSTVQLSNSDDNQIRFFLAQAVVSPAVKKALGELRKLKSALAETSRDLQHQSRELATIEQDQNRLRSNLREMPQTADAYKRYLKKFDEQETEIERLHKLIKELRVSETAQRKAIDDYLSKLTVE